MTSKILPCDLSSISLPSSSSLPEVSDPTTLANLQLAARHLQNNELVAFPTETVYGLGGSALASSSAVPKIFKAKGRPSDNPLIVHIASASQLGSLVDPSYLNQLPECYPALMKRFWPGPLTLLFPTVPGKLVSEKVTCGLSTVGVRVPSHPVVRALLALSGVPVAAPSANTSGRPSPTTARHVDMDLNGKEELTCILDGGDCTVGLESTVVSALRDTVESRDGKETLRVLRLGGVSPEDLQACLEEAGLGNRLHLSMEAHSPSNGKQVNGHGEETFIPSTPGMKYKHYSPDAKVILIRPVDSEQAISLQDILKPYQGKKIGLLHLTSCPILGSLAHHTDNLATICLGDPQDYQIQAQRLFGGLRSLDEQGVDLILVEAVQEEGLGRTVMERLRKSAGGNEPVDVKL